MTFKDFCITLACVNEHTVAGDDVTVPSEYATRFTIFANTMKNQIERFDRIEMGYIQTAMRDASLTSKITAAFPNEEIPNGMINTLAITLYGKKYDELENDIKMIINVLVIYFIISSN